MKTGPCFFEDVWLRRFTLARLCLRQSRKEEADASTDDKAIVEVVVFERRFHSAHPESSGGPRPQPFRSLATVCRCKRKR